MSRSILVTGGSSGIGLFLASLMSEQGNDVVTIARDHSKIVNRLNIDQYDLDLSDVAVLPERLKSNKQLNKAFDVLVLNAGYGRFGGIEQFSYEQIRHLVDTNLISNLFLIKHYLPLMKAQGGGDIVLLGSESALQGAKEGSVYCATKFALRGLAQSLRADCSTSNIRVMLINPGPVDSGFFDELKFEPQDGDDFVLSSVDVANAIVHSLEQPRNVVCDEINLQPMKRSFKTVSYTHLTLPTKA